MAAALASPRSLVASLSLASRTPSFNNRAIRASSPRPGSATPTPLATAGALGDADAVVSAASVLLTVSTASRGQGHAFECDTDSDALEAGSVVDLSDEVMATPVPPGSPPPLRDLLEVPLPPELSASPLPPLPPLPPHRPQHAQHANQQQQRARQNAQQGKGSFHEAYEIGELLGRGTFGEVRCATERATGRQVAVKVMPRNHRGHDSRGAIYKEVDFCQELQDCPTTVRLFGVYEDSASIYIVQELCSGGDVAGLMAAAGGHLDEREAAAVMLQALRFLAHAHRAGVCYGDVKPNNFVLRSLYPGIAHMLDPREPKGQISLCAVDFGCCQHVEAGACVQDVPISGTPAYLSPEAFRQCFGMPSDVWAAGVMLYHLLTGSFPFWVGGAEQFHGMTASELRDGIVRGSPMFVKGTWSSYSPRAKDLICKMLEKDPEQRISAAEATAHQWFAEVLGAGEAAGRAPAARPNM